MKVSPQNTNRMVDGCRRLLNSLLADVYIFTDAVSGKESGLSPGYGMTLVAETTSGCLISAEACAMQVCVVKALKQRQRLAQSLTLKVTESKFSVGDAAFLKINKAV